MGGGAEGRRRGGIGCEGSIRDGVNGTVETGFGVGSRFKGSVRNGFNGAGEPGFAVGSRFKGSIRDGLNCGVGPGFAAGCECAGPGFSRGASGWDRVIKKQGILAANERKLTQMWR